MFIQDYLTLKVLKSKNKSNIKLNAWDKVIYEKEWHKYVWTYIWYDCEYDYEVNFLYKLVYWQLEKFYRLDKTAKELFYNIKEDLKIVFPNIKFSTAKMNFVWNIIYIYFYSEERIDFRPYLKELKKLIWMNFFIYQVWARDSIRLNTENKNILWDCWLWLCCINFNCKLPSVESSIINLQNLQTQWIDRQKWICWKLKCCLKYEEKIYQKELKNYPEVWTDIEKDWKIYTVIWINVLLKYMFLKDKDGVIIQENL